MAATASLTGCQDGGLLPTFSRGKDDIEALTVDRLQVEEREDNLHVVHGIHAWY
jgi:hypothetical protein